MGEKVPFELVYKKNKTAQDTMRGVPELDYSESKPVDPSENRRLDEANQESVQAELAAALAKRDAEQRMKSEEAAGQIRQQINEIAGANSMENKTMVVEPLTAPEPSIPKKGFLERLKFWK